MNVGNPTIQLSDCHMFLVFLESTHQAYESAAASIVLKMPLMNLLLKTLSARDPTVRGLILILNELLKLPELVTIVLLTEEENEVYDQELAKL